MAKTVGKVIKILGDIGYVSSEDLPGEEIWFHMSRVKWWDPPIREEDHTAFVLKMVSGRPQAWYMERVGEPAGPSSDSAHDSPTVHGNPKPSSGNLLDWAYLGYLPNALTALKEMAFKERWEFKNKPQDPERPFPILFSYLLHTFGRLFFENKIWINEAASVAAFNTGLVDCRYEDIHALFRPNRESRGQYWWLAGFCVAGEYANGQDLVRHFNPIPPPAHYFDDPSDLIYDIRAGKPECNWDHIIIENIDRFPREFIEDHCPPGFTVQETMAMTEGERELYFSELRRAVEEHARTYRVFMNRLKDGLDLAIKRVSWNFKTAIPQYYPKVRRLQLLLPICLVSDERVDLALAVEKTHSGKYLAHTIFSLDWAYRNARLVCKPDSDWLDPEEITEAAEEQPEG